MATKQSAREKNIEAIRQRFKGRRMSAYGIGILEDVLPVDPAVRPEDTPQIEDVMRTQHSTLDHLDHPRFRRLARLAWEAVKELRVTDARYYPLPHYPKRD